MLFEDAFGADVFGVVVVFVDAEVILAGELGLRVVRILVLLGFDVADVIA